VCEYWCVAVIWRVRRHLRLLGLHWRTHFRHMARIYKLLATILGVIIISSIFIWHHYGTGKSLPVLADITPILLAIVGIIMSYIQPRRESHFVTTVVLVLAGLGGSAVLSLNRIRDDASHLSEMSGLDNKIDAVQRQNTILENFLLSAKSAGKISEVDRRRGIETVLRNDYILSHNPIDPQILAGNKMPPDEWMNRRLREMGENWQVANAGPLIRPQIVQQLLPEPKKANVEFSFDQGDMSHGPLTLVEDPMKDRIVKVSITAMATGDTPAEDLHIWIRECIGCDWKSPLPPGFSPSDPETPFDRDIVFPELLPNIKIQKWDFTIQLPLFLASNALGIACYYACKNCAAVDWGRPQMLWVRQPRTFKMQYPPILYAPKILQK